MIKVCMLYGQGNLVGFTAEGHANYAQDGSDIVCSAVSALTQTTLLGLKERLNLPLAAEIDEDTGIHCVLGSECTQAQRKDAALLLDTMLLGLLSIQAGYGDYLIITEREV
ncbi:ribosomal-processing cysteine protease Prp [Christensenellaceae bacterium OttesenSCG-928-L17]|nr:ribosomal-processing cysteine protease Prp [Christensenellaceae bacterium OttesenSCG-928-L17]